MHAHSNVIPLLGPGWDGPGAGPKTSMGREEQKRKVRIVGLAKSDNAKYKVQDGGVGRQLKLTFCYAIKLARLDHFPAKKKA